MTELTKKEIGEVMHAYLPEHQALPSFFYARHHVDPARIVIAACRNTTLTIDEVMELIQLTYPTPCDPMGDYALSVKYLYERYGKEKLVPEYDRGVEMRSLV